MDIKKVIIPAAGLATRFLPLSKIVSKEFLPLVDAPMISYVVREAKNSDINQVVFVLPEHKKGIASEYFKSKPKLESILKKRGQKEILDRVQKINQDF